MCSRSSWTTRVALGPGSGVIKRGSFACGRASVLMDSFGIERLYTRSRLVESGTSHGCAATAPRRQHGRRSEVAPVRGASVSDANELRGYHLFETSFLSGWRISFCSRQLFMSAT